MKSEKRPRVPVRTYQPVRAFAAILVITCRNQESEPKQRIHAKAVAYCCGDKLRNEDGFLRIKFPKKVEGEEAGAGCGV